MKLDERARRAAEAVREQAEAVDPAPALERIRGDREGRRRVVLVGVGAAAALASIVAVAVLVVQQPDRGPVIDPLVPGDDQTEPAPSEPPPLRMPPPDPVGTWTQVRSESFAGPSDQVITGIAVADGIAVAVGGDGEQAAVWRSGPGDVERWERAPADLCGEASCTIRDVTTVPEGFLAVGQLDGLPKAWTSEDGLDWRRVDLPAPRLDGAAALHRVAEGGDGSLVALGPVERLGADGALVAYRATSPGGPWEEVDIDVPSPQESPASVGDLAWFAGGFVAIVHDAGDGFSFLRSDDGIAWTEHGPEPGVFEPYPTFPSTLLVHGDRLLATGATYGADGGDAAVWTSDDGRSWQRLARDDLSSPGHQTAVGAGVVGGRPVMVGEGFRGGSDAGDVAFPAAWLSSGQDTWTRIEGGTDFEDTNSFTMAVPWDDGTLLVAGARYAEAGVDASLWIYRVPDADPSEDLGSCSSDPDRPAAFTDRPELPAGVADMRRAIWEAAVACDVETLEQLALGGTRGFTYSFGEDGAPARYWTRHEEEGAQPLLQLAQLLAGESATIETQFRADVYETVHVWPAGFAEEDGYLGLRVGITADGEWVFFVAGD